jgi:HEAT repeat protein
MLRYGCIGAGLAAVVLAAVPCALRAQVPSYLGKPLSRWARELSSPDAAVRRNAAFALGKAGPQALSQADRLIHALKDKSAEVRNASAFALGELGETLWPPAHAPLADLLTHDPDPLVRRSAAFALGKLGHKGMTDDEEEAATVYPALEKALGDADPAVRQDACWALGRLGPLHAPGAVPGLCRRLADEDAPVRREAAAALGAFGARAHDAVPLLLSRFQEDKDTEVRKSAVSALVNLVRPTDKTAVGPLRAALQEEDRDIVHHAALALANIGGKDGAVAVPVLCRQLQSKDADSRWHAAAALAGIGPEAAAGVAPLNMALKDPEPEVRKYAALALGRIGAKAEPAVPTLTGLLESPSERHEVRLLAGEALSQIVYLVQLTPNVRPVIPRLLRVLREDTSVQVRTAVVMILAQVEDLEPAGIVPGLTAVLSETEAERRLVRYNSAYVLGMRLGSRAPERTVENLLALLEDKYVTAGLREPSAKVTSTGPESKGGQATVTRETGSDPRLLAAQALGRIGSKANRPGVIRSLNELIKSPDVKVRATAKEALAKIQGP